MTELLRDVAYQRFKEKLLSGEIPLGSFISQREISSLIEVPLSPTREALKKLESENLVRHVAQRGIQVCQIDFTLIQETFQLRTFLEISALEVFVDTVSDTQIDRLLERTEAAVLALEGNVPDQKLLEDVRATDRALHEALIGHLANSTISEVYEQNFAKIRLIRLNGKHLPGRSREIMAEHMQILRAIKARDFPRAKEALTLHLNVSHERALGLTSRGLTP